MSVIASVLQMVWGFFQVEMPLLGISYGTFTIGLFVVHLSISLLFPLLGIGGDVASSVGSGIRNSDRLTQSRYVRTMRNRDKAKAKYRAEKSKKR